MGDIILFPAPRPAHAQEKPCNNCVYRSTLLEMLDMSVRIIDALPTAAEEELCDS